MIVISACVIASLVTNQPVEVPVDDIIVTEENASVVTQCVSQEDVERARRAEILKKMEAKQ